jgi:predicted O-methyltransferase YrrM
MLKSSSWPRKLLRRGSQIAWEWRFQLQQRWLAFQAWRLQRNRPLKSIQLADLASLPVALAPPILEDIWLPPYLADAVDQPDDLTPLLTIVRARQPWVVVELGTGYGNVSANICRQSPEAKVYTVNAVPQNQSGQITTYVLGREAIGRVYRQHGFAERVTQIYQNTLDIDWTQYLAPQSVDLAIIDACHDTDYVLTDFMKVSPFIQPQGLVLFHDTDTDLRAQARQRYKAHLTSSYLACLMLVQRGFDVRHLPGTWWAVWSPAFASNTREA